MGSPQSKYIPQLGEVKMFRHNGSGIVGSPKVAQPNPSGLLKLFTPYETPKVGHPNYHHPKLVKWTPMAYTKRVNPSCSPVECLTLWIGLQKIIIKSRVWKSRAQLSGGPGAQLSGGPGAQLSGGPGVQLSCGLRALLSGGPGAPISGGLGLT